MLEALRGDKRVQVTAAKYTLHPDQVSTFKLQVIDGVVAVVSGGKQNGPTDAEVKKLHAKIGRLLWLPPEMQEVFDPLCV